MIRTILPLLFILFLCTCVRAQERTIFEDNFDNGAFQPEWTLRPNLQGINGVVDVNVNVGFNGSPAARIGKFQNSELTVNALDLSLDLSGETQVELRYFILDVNDRNQFQDGLYFSDNGGMSFTKVFEYVPEEWCDGRYGTFPHLDVDKLAATNGLELTSQFVIRFQQAGTRSFNGDGNGDPDGFYLENVRVLEPTIEFAGLPFEDDFNNNSFKDAWHWDFPNNSVEFNLPNSAVTTNNVIGINPTASFDGSPAVFIGRDCNGPLSVTSLDLRLNLEGQEQVEMGFDITDYNDQNHIDDAILFSDDGGESFAKVKILFPEEWCDYTFGRYPMLDVDELAAAADLELTANFVVRFQQMDNRSFNGDGNGNPAGFVIDNVFVREEVVAYASLPFEDKFDDGTFTEFWAVREPTQTVSVSLPNSPDSPANAVGVGTNSGINNTPGVFIGRRCNGPTTVNALDLRLDLADEDQVELAFWIRDINDQNQEDDGLYFSDDGGITFAKVLTFRPDEWCDRVYGYYPLDLDKLAAQAGLELTSTFVVRFQQMGSRSFNGDGNGNPDGIEIDEVAVFDPEIEYAPIPFEDNFNENVTKPAWRRAFADQTVEQVIPNDIFTPMNWSGVDPASGIDGTSGLFMGRRCNGPLTVNAYDLHLNLADRFNVKLDFVALDFNDQNNVDDGLYFSNDAGANWKKALDFMPEEWADRSWFDFPTVDISAIAEELEMPLTETFIVRFQQVGNRSFNGDGNGNPDGMYFDNVNVTASPTSVVAGNDQPQLFEVFPNPASTSVNIKFTSGDARWLVLYSPLGQQLIQQKLSQAPAGSTHLLDLEDFPPGVYQLVVTDLRGGRSATKLVVQ